MVAEENYYYEEQEVLEQKIVRRKIKKPKFINKFITILAIGFFGIFVIFQQASIAKQQTLKYSLQQKLDDVKAINEKLKVELASETTLDSITTKAQGKYGMQFPENGQIVNIKLKALKSGKVKSSNTNGLPQKLLKIFSK